jgi:hypothetical protein
MLANQSGIDKAAHFLLTDKVAMTFKIAAAV